MKGLLCDEEIIAYENTPSHKLWALSVYSSNQSISNCWVERLVLEPVYDDEGVVIGTTVQYAVGIELLWYTKLLKPIISSNIRRSWMKAVHQLDQYIIDQKREQEVKN
jgi:hypothetical protein